MNFKIFVLKNTLRLGIFKIYPIYSGYGITIGNSLRRILLSSLYGYTISYFRIKGVLHEYSTINGIVEDVTSIILNFKQIRLKLKKKIKINREKINIKIKNKINKIYAGDIDKFSKYFEIVNKELVICNKDESKKISIEFIIDKGKGYLPADKKKKYKDFIPIDSIYTPIKNVSFKVKNFYKNKNKNKYSKEILYLNIRTDGTISPIISLLKSCRILIKIYKNFINKNKYYKNKHI
ncbi:MAG: DNA-directed RNA polymerase subunit alpha [Candidatus Shikimatogenerans bostrichidophilus]|nr:MAG: DNA-directed RNA polymerase subunit alpha [Candidatus Shikimatogenerans bostrichidophilus]